MESQVLAPRERHVVVLISLLQGLLLYFAELARANDGWPLNTLASQIAWYTLIIGVLSAMSLSIERLNEKRYWQHLLLIAVVLVITLSWVIWSVSAPGIDLGTIAIPYALTMTAALFVALPFLQCRQLHGRFTWQYHDLFEFAWRNGLSLAIALLFVGLSWMVLWLWAGVFKLIGIDFFKILFQSKPFAYLATGIMVGLGLLIGRLQSQALSITRRLCLALSKGLLPLLASIALLFVASLPFTGLEPLWNTKSATTILLGLLAALIISLNAVYQNGRGEGVSYPVFLQRLVQAGVLTLPILAGLSIAALWLRIDQYGWTTDRYWVGIMCMLGSALALGYASLVILSKSRWLERLGHINRVVALLGIALIVASHSFVLDPFRLTTQSQLARFEVKTPKLSDMKYLRFDNGRRGYEAIQAFSLSPTVSADPHLAETLRSIVEQSDRFDPWKPSIEHLRKTVRSEHKLPDALLQSLIDSGNLCANSDQACVAHLEDLDNDGQDDALVCSLEGSLSCHIYALETSSNGPALWKSMAQYSWYVYGDKSDAYRQAILNGEIQWQPERWPNAKIQGDDAHRF